jgi:peptide methionine sulfoxide reductase msrA/msrB
MDTGFPIGRKKASNLSEKEPMKIEQKNTLSRIALLGLVSFTITNTPALAEPDMQTAYFAGGCFWCTETDFEKIDGVSEVIAGFMGGEKANPSYIDVASGKTQHRETVKVVFDPGRVSYQKLLSAFWRMHDPSDATGSFVDRGRQYSSAIYYVDAEQRRLAEGGAKALDASGKFETPIATSIEPASEFYVAEAYHQDYYLKSPLKYKYYRYRSGRDQFIEAMWAGDDTVYQSAQ